MRQSWADGRRVCNEFETKVTRKTCLRCRRRRKETMKKQQDAEAPDAILCCSSFPNESQINTTRAPANQLIRCLSAPFPSSSFRLHTHSVYFTHTHTHIFTDRNKHLRARPALPSPAPPSHPIPSHRQMIRDYINRQRNQIVPRSGGRFTINMSVNSPDASPSAALSASQRPYRRRWRLLLFGRNVCNARACTSDMHCQHHNPGFGATARQAGNFGSGSAQTRRTMRAAFAGRERDASDVCYG